MRSAICLGMRHAMLALTQRVLSAACWTGTTRSFACRCAHALLCGAMRESEASTWRAQMREMGLPCNFASREVDGEEGGKRKRKAKERRSGGEPWTGGALPMLLCHAWY